MPPNYLTVVVVTAAAEQSEGGFGGFTMSQTHAFDT